MMISKSTKLEVLKNIDDFNLFFENDKIEQKKKMEKNMPQYQEIGDSDFGSNQNFRSTHTLHQLFQTSPSPPKFFSKESDPSKGNFFRALDTKFVNTQQEINNEEPKETPARAIQYKVNSNQESLKQIGTSKRASHRNEIMKEQDSHNNSSVKRGANDQADASSFAVDVTNNNLNDSQQDLVSSASQKENQSAQLKSIYLGKKVKKIAVILAFSAIIIAFYIISYFLTNKIFNSAIQSFEYLQVIDQRGPCVTDSLIYMLESFAQNETLYVKFGQQKAFDHLKEDCLRFESQYQGYLQNPPVELARIHQEMKDLNTDQLCRITIRDPQAVEDCETYYMGILKTGLKNTLQSIYHNLIVEWIILNSVEPHKRTDQFLDQHQIDDETKAYSIMILRYIEPIFEYLQEIVDHELRNYLKSQLDNFVVLFVMLVFFLLASLVFSLKVLIDTLKKVVFRTRVLIKIIPVYELQKISRQIMMEKVND